MTPILAEEHKVEDIALRDAYVQSLMEVAETDDRLLAVDADLMLSINLGPFTQRFPDRAINCGVQEANMIGVSAGLSVMGFVPYAHTFACFASRRVFDQVFMSCAYSHLNVRVVGSDPGITAIYNGGTHMAFEDVGVMRLVPGMTILEPVDSIMMRDLIRQTAQAYGMFYIRLMRRPMVRIYDEGSSFTIGKAIELRPGSDVTLIASGFLVADALRAAEQLAARGVSARVLHMFTIKPIDREAVLAAAEETGAVVTIENHSILNGLGAAVAEVLVEGFPVPMERVGVRDEFGEVGPLDYLQKRFKLTVEEIVLRAEKVLARKAVPQPG